MADWIDYRMETFSRQLADDPRMARLRPIDHSLLTRDVEALMREAWAAGRTSARQEAQESIDEMRSRLTTIHEVSRARSRASHEVHSPLESETQADEVRDAPLVRCCGNKAALGVPGTNVSDPRGGSEQEGGSGAARQDDVDAAHPHVAASIEAWFRNNFPSGDAAAQRRDSVSLADWLGARSSAAASRIKVVPAPGDRCGNTKILSDGSPCPGCRACS